VTITIPGYKPWIRKVVRTTLDDPPEKVVVKLEK